MTVVTDNSINLIHIATQNQWGDIYDLHYSNHNMICIKKINTCDTGDILKLAL